MLKDNLLKELACLELNLARLKCLTLLLTSLLRQRTVNLTILATENLTSAKNEYPRRGQSTHLNIFSSLRTRFLVFASVLPLRMWRLIEFSWPISKRVAIQRFVTSVLVLVFKSVAIATFLKSLFFHSFPLSKEKTKQSTFFYCMPSIFLW